MRSEYLYLLAFLIAGIVFIGGCTGRPITKEDFEIKSLEYTSIDPGKGGNLKLVVDTKVRNLRIVARSQPDRTTDHSRPDIFCGNECESPGECSINWCQGDPAHKFYVNNVSRDYNISVCAYSGNKYKACKEVFLPAYSGALSSNH